MPALLQYFSRLFTFGLALDERLSRDGRPSQSPGEIYAELRRRLEQAKAAALKGQRRAEDVEEASFAVVAWLDEIIARHPEHWEAATSLQVTLFDTTNAGNEFFSHLRALSAQQDEVREVYYVAMCLGFVGQYYYETGDTGDLGKLKETHVRHLPVAAVPIHALSDLKITAQPYGVADPSGPRLPSRWPERAAKAGMLAAVATVVGIIAYYLIAGEHKKEIYPNADSVAKQLERYACHDFTLQSQDAGRLQVTGHVRTVTERERLAKELRSLPGGKWISVNVETLSEPFCEVVGVVALQRRSNTASEPSLKISTRGAGERLVEGQTITLDANLPAHPVCLYVDYFVADGSSVVHLFPSTDDARSCGLAGQTVPIGEPKPGKPPWKVSEPLGREMVLALASPTPLFKREREGIETPKDYLAALRQALEARGEDVVADYVLVTTEKK